MLCVFYFMKIVTFMKWHLPFFPSWLVLETHQDHLPAIHPHASVPLL